MGPRRGVVFIFVLDRRAQYSAEVNVAQLNRFARERSLVLATSPLARVLARSSTDASRRRCLRSR
jgi:hypothetical protein